MRDLVKIVVCSLGAAVVACSSAPPSDAETGSSKEALIAPEEGVCTQVSGDYNYLDAVAALKKFDCGGGYKTITCSADDYCWISCCAQDNAY
jgi:hypothetical protein